jgi:hypothetical protein
MKTALKILQGKYNIFSFALFVWRKLMATQKNMDAFQKQLKNGSIQKAYSALIHYMMDLRTHFKTCYPKYSISGLYQGYMDMTYFAIIPPSFKRRSLKIAIVFNYDAFRFEAWLAGANRQVQRKYWELIRDSQWTQYRIVTPAKGVDSIIKSTLAEDFDFSDLDRLTANIEKKAITFIDDVEKFLSAHESK